MARAIGGLEVAQVAYLPRRPGDGQAAGLSLAGDTGQKGRGFIAARCVRARDTRSYGGRYRDASGRSRVLRELQRLPLRLRKRISFREGGCHFIGKTHFLAGHTILRIE
jgi:hypothetical protein